jgi:Rod binding domain-containing protein
MVSGVQNIGDLAVTQSFTSRVGGRLGSSANIDKAAQDFEGMFMSQMLQPMFEGLGVDPVFGGGHGEEIMRSFLVQEYGKIAAKNGHYGIAAAVKNEMIKAQANAAGAASNQGGKNAITP